MEANIFDIFKEQAEEFKVSHLADALIESVKDIGYAPQRLRVFTSYKAYTNNLDGVKRANDTEVLYEDSKKFNVKYGGIPYFYAYADKIDRKPEDKYNSIFLGVNYSSNSFNRFKILKRGSHGRVNYVVYVAPNAPKCLRVGVIGRWSKEDLFVFNPTAKSNFFGDEEKEGDSNG